MIDIERFLMANMDFVDYYGNPPSDYKVLCPFCVTREGTPDTKGHLNVSMLSQTAHCFRCGYSRSWVGLVMDITGYAYYKALGELYETPSLADYGKRNIKEESYGAIPSQANLPDGFTRLDFAGDGAELARRYMRKRGFGEDYWILYNIGYADSLPNRVIIPIEDGYWQGRAIYKWMDPKYVNPKMVNRNLLFNSKAMELYDEIVVCEGAISAMAVGPNAVALISKEPTKERLARIAGSSASHVIIALEPRAFGTMGKMADYLKAEGKQVTIWNFSVGDPADPKAAYESMEYDFAAKIRIRLENLKFGKIANKNT